MIYKFVKIFVSLYAMEEELPFGISPEIKNRLIDDEHLKEIISIKEVKRYKVNPFTVDLIINKEPVYKKDHTFTKLGENFMVAKEVGQRDKAKFVRVFDTEIDIKNIKGNTAKILLHIIYNKINYDVSILHLTSEEITNLVGITNISSMNEALLELIKLKYIAKQVENNWYWINPAKIYKGDRKRIEI